MCFEFFHLPVGVAGSWDSFPFHFLLYPSTSRTCKAPPLSGRMEMLSWAPGDGWCMAELKQCLSGDPCYPCCSVRLANQPRPKKAKGKAKKSVTCLELI